jgi:hypothetical protein
MPKFRPLLRYARAVLAMLLAVYLLFLVAMFVIMRQPPDRFGQIMKHFPMPALMLVPFEPMWNVARGGEIALGDVAPEFNLRTADKRDRVSLASFRGQKPVVLVFGSYT